MKLISTNYGLIIVIPKIANPSIIPAGIIVIIASFDMFFLSPTFLTLPRICIVNPFWN